jgi:hypothetical protein
MSARETGRTRALIALGGVTLALCLLAGGRRGGGGGKGDHDEAPGTGGVGGVGAGGGLFPKRDVRIWLRSGDRVELDGVNTDLPTAIETARAVGRASVYATGDARVGWIGKVINALRAAQVSVLADAHLLSEADYVQSLAEARGLRPTSDGMRNAGEGDGNMSWVLAGDVVVGDAVVEADGYLLAVLDVTRSRGIVTMRLASDFSPMSSWRSTGKGIEYRKRVTSKVAIVRGAGWNVVPSLRG